MSIDDVENELRESISTVGEAIAAVERNAAADISLSSAGRKVVQHE